MKGKCGKLDMLCWVLLLVGGLNWGLVGLAGLVSPESNYNVVNLLFGSMPTLEAVVYLLVGVAAVVMLVKMCTCKGGSCGGGTCEKPE